MIELLGFAGLALTASSLLQSKMKNFRLLSLSGGLFFLHQAILLGTISLIVTNVVFITINSVMLYKLISNKVK